MVSVALAATQSLALGASTPTRARVPRRTAGLWEFQLGSGFAEAVPFGQTLNQTILVPFPLESCLSGAFRWPAYSKFLWYRLLFDAPFASGNTLLHFGAVDWNTTAYLNGKMLGNHLGGYDGFSFDLTGALAPTNNELILAVYDPSDEGFQVEGKQRISAIHSPGGDTYTPSSGVWQTVWLENVAAYSIASLAVRGDTQNVYVTVNAGAAGTGTASGTVSFAGAQVATFSGATGAEIVVAIPSPKLWGPLNPNLYDLTITATQTGTGASDTVGSYVGMRSVGTVSFPVPPTPASGPRVGYDNSGGDMPNQPTTLPQPDFNLCWASCNNTPGCAAWSYGVQGAGCEAKPLCWLKASVESWSQNSCRIAGDQGTAGGHALRPAINGNFTFLAGWLDQSWWSDGEYTAPTDDALAFDLQAVVDFGLNVVRLHQKVNSERWYYHADRLGVVIIQDMIQKYGGATQETIPDFMMEIKAMIDGRGNHPSIVQWTVFNEGSCAAWLLRRALQAQCRQHHRRHRHLPPPPIYLQETARAFSTSLRRRSSFKRTTLTVWSTPTAGARATICISRTSTTSIPTRGRAARRRARRSTR